MDLWRWVQACPLLHLVSRRLPGLPGFPNGLLLHDVAITRSRLRGRSEDLLFVEDPRLIQRARRGLSFVEPIGGGEATVVRRGLPKFFDIDAACLAEASCSLGAPGTMVSQATLSQSQGAASKLLADSIQQAISANAAISLTKLQKANGENVQVSYHATTGQWVLCSKNVSILASCAPELELPQWADRRYRFARQVGALWFQQLSALEEASCKSLRETLASATLIGEMVGGSGAHLVQYGPDRKLQWFAVVPHEGEEACWVPSRSHSFFQKIGLPSVEFGHHMEVYKTVESLLDALSQMVLTVEKAPLSEAGEGYVLYISAQPDTSHLDEANGSRVIHMGKLKTAEYRALRRMRDKAKQFAKSAGCLLVEDVLEDFRREATLLEEDVVETHANTLGKLCRLIFAEDLPAEEVDEKFLDLLQRAESHHGTDAPRRPAPALCLVVPPFQVDGQLAAALQALLKDRGQMKPSPPAPGGPGTQGGLERSCAELHKENLASAWYASTASKAKVYLNHIPIHVEGLFVPRDGEPAQKRRRMEMEERRNQSSSQLAQALGQRCLFILWGWSGWSTLPQLQIKQSRGQSPTESRLLRSKQLRSASGVFFQKLQAQALNLKAKLPQGQTLWLPGLPSLSDQRAMSTIATSIEQAWANTEAPNPVRELQWQEASRATVVAIIPLALPGMGKSSLLEALFKRCQRGGLKCYRQGKLLDKAGALDPSFSALPIQPSSAAIVSSDGFTGEELQFMGLTAAGSSSQDVARCRRQAAHRYRKAIEDFLIAAASGVDAVHLLLLDKNHPPSSLRNEVEVLQSTCKNLGCRLFPRALAIDFVEAEASELEKQLLQEEEKHFGPWAYPWNPSVIAECGARLLLRSSHDTLAGGETSLFVLLSFLYLHKRFTLDERSVGIPVIKSPYLSTTGALASWTSDEPDSLWCRLEVRALLQQILSCLRKPFDDQQKWKPLLTSLVLHLRSQQLQVPDELLRQAHTEGCAESIWTAIFAALEQVEPPAQPQYFVPAFRYVALDVDGHHAVIESLLTKVSMAIRAITDACPDDEPFQSPEFLRPKSLHVTTCFLGSTIGDAQRKVLAASKSLVSENATFDCSITHLVAAPGALAFAVVDGSRLRGDGVPMAEEQRPHITMCTQLPWQPRHSNEVLEAVTLWLDDATVHAAGKWVRNVKVKSSVLDVFILQLERPVVLSSNPVQLC